MGTPNRLIIAAALAGVLLLLGGAAFLMPRINDERRATELDASEHIMDLPPKYRIALAALGTFRGLFVDVLWARAEQMKQDGQYHEAMQLSEWITTLQPRFAQVWAIRAWDMAYNISVATHTPQERWSWVRKGIALLRDQGIPLNPDSVPLYKELAWFFLHKVGKLSDDMHWYYKQQLAVEWHDLLGAPPDGDTETVIQWFRLIAETYERFLLKNELGKPVRRSLSQLAAIPELAEDVKPLQSFSIQKTQIRLQRLAERLQAKEPKLAEKVRAALGVVNQQLALRAVDPLQRLIEAEPAVAERISVIRSLGAEPDRRFAAGVVGALARAASADLKLREIQLPPRIADSDRRVVEWLGSEQTEQGRAARLLLAFIRARTLSRDYHMDPLWMLELMEGEWFVREDLREQKRKNGQIPRIPIEWRHPAAHGLYWASLGVRRSQGLLRRGEAPILNTDRHILHALQDLRHNGRLIFDPITRYNDRLPDPRYIRAYHEAVFGALERMGDKLNREIPETFRAGHENFLIASVQAEYFYGSEAGAEYWYAMLRRLYGRDRPDLGLGQIQRENRAALYSQPLKQFVESDFVINESITNLDDTNAAVGGFLFRAINDGLALGRDKSADRFFRQARVAHSIYQKRQDFETRGAPRNRMALRPFEQLFENVLANYILSPDRRINRVMRARVWANAPISVKQRIYDRIKERLYKMATALKLSPEKAFPEPPGMAEYRKKHPPTQDPGKNKPGPEVATPDKDKKRQF